MFEADEMLQFDSAWRYESPGTVHPGVQAGFLEFINRIATQGDRWSILEHFKVYFAQAAGSTSSRSSSSSWAESDISSYMASARDNAPLFIEAFYDGCEALRQTGFGVPEIRLMNRVLADFQVPYEIQPPCLVALSQHASVPAPERVRSLDQEAQDKIHESLTLSEKLLAEGRYRPAVQELLWLIETVSTAFRGMETASGTIQGKYFNKIAENLRLYHRGSELEQVISWMTTLHGYLSSPTGGGIRHGADLAGELDIDRNEARLYCNLIRSYVTYLMAEHERLSAAQPIGLSPWG